MNNTIEKGYKANAHNLNDENTPYKVGTRVHFKNGFGAIFLGHVTKVFYDTELQRHHYAFGGVKLIKEPKFKFGPNSVKATQESYLHSHVILKLS